MKNLALIILLSFLLVFMGYAQESENFANNQLIVKFNKAAEFNYRSGLTRQKFEQPLVDELNEVFSVEDIAMTGNKRQGNTFILRFAVEQDIRSLVEQYMETGLFEYVEPNYIGHGAGQLGTYQVFPNDQYFSRQYGLYNDGSFSLSPAVVDADVDMELAWDIETGDSNIIIAVLDAGAKLDHPEFDGRIWINHDESINGSDDDGNGYVDDVKGWDFVNNDNDPTDDHGHGTNVAGIIGANANNGIGYAGVNWHSQLMICKILDNTNSGLYSWWTDGIYYAVDNGAKVLNMSVGGDGFSMLMEDAVNYAYNNGVTVVVSMMNFNNSVPYYPAAYQNTIGVGSTDANDERSDPFFWSATSGSNYGNHIDVIAPGNFIYGLDYQSNTNYNTYWGGTSQAAPLVSGLCGLLLAQDSSRSPSDLRNILRNSAEDQVGNPAEDVPGFDVYYGYGRVNAFQALTQPATALDDLLEEPEFYVYPNLTAGTLDIFGLEEAGSIIISDALGQRMYVGEVGASSTELNVNATTFGKGIYIVLFVRDGDHRVFTQKVILR